LNLALPPKKKTFDLLRLYDEIIFLRFMKPHELIKIVEKIAKIVLFLSASVANSKLKQQQNIFVTICLL